MWKKSHNNNSGFTLTEMLVVIAIIGILSAIIVPALVAYVRDAKLDTANANAKYIYNAAVDYSQKCINYGAKIPSGSYAIHIADPGDMTTTVVPDHMFENGHNSLTEVGGYLTDAINVEADRDLYGTWCRVYIDDYGRVLGTIWWKGKNDQYVGGYPHVAEDTNWTINDAIGA